MTSFLALAFRGRFFFVGLGFFLPFFFSPLFYHCVWFIIAITNCNFDPILALSAFPYDSPLPRSTLPLQTVLSTEVDGVFFIVLFQISLF